MSGAKEAIQVAITEATEETAQTKTKANTQTTGTTITFGTFTFIIDHNDFSDHLYNNSPEKTKENQLLVLHDNIHIPVNLKNFENSKNKPNPVQIQASIHRKPNYSRTKTKLSKERPLPTKQIRTTPRFIKIPPATSEWQKAVSKVKVNKRRIRKCFYCHKEGHTQRFCWSKIKCYGCGRTGHKWAKCLFKEMVSHNITSKKPEQKNSARKHQPSARMDIIQGRPLLGDVFCPQRQNLSEEHEYLSKVGLLVMIRGFPTPDLPQLVTAKLLEVHGGHPTDYAITQATITPYIITCPNTIIRDTIVQRGIYSIPQMGIQFKIHEWRLRFGMGYDPPTHQAWIKLVGLPLQAWTVSEVTAILRKFGHPLQVLPFGQAAGHHRDITALVATMHPSRIPLAYQYREGDYSMQFDVLILSWRLWEDDHFPPPGYPMLQEDPHHQPHQQNDQMAVANRSSSSSSSNNAPSEPTIDLSSWSPRSYRSEIPRSCGSGPTTGKKWTPIAKSFQQRKGRDTSKALSTAAAQLSAQSQPPPSTNNPAFSITGQILLQRLNPQKRHHPATGDPTCPHNPQWTFPLIQICLLSIPTPIHITPPLFSLLMDQQQNRTKQAPQKRHATAAPHAASLEHSTQPMPLCLAEAYKPPTLMIIQAILQEHHKKKASPVRPISCSPLHKPFSLMTHPEPSPMHFSQTQAQTQNSVFFSDNSSNVSADSESPKNASLSSFPIALETQQHLAQLANNKLSLESNIALAPLQTHDKRDLNMSQVTPLTDISIHPPPTSNAARKEKREKSKKLPTRRSQRLQVKQRTSDTASKSLARNSSKKNGLLFHLEATETPINIAATFAILQATGLEINKHIQDIVEEADRQDQNFEQSKPLTPLHDPIPPLTVPDFDLPL